MSEKRKRKRRPVGDEVVPQIQDSNGKLRACIRCKLIKTDEQFAEEGCNNCSRNGRHEPADYGEWSTPDFEGTIALMAPKDSWVAKWNGLKECCPGVYCKALKGQATVRDDEFDEDAEDLID